MLDAGAVDALVDVAGLAGEADIGLYLVAGDGIAGPALCAAGQRELFDVYSGVQDALDVLAKRASEPLPLRWRPRAAWSR